MPRVAIRRLHLRGLAPRDHPSPSELETRLTDAARKHLAEALAGAVSPRPDGTVLRIRRLDVDISLGTSFDPEAFAIVLAQAIAAAIRRAAEQATETSDGIVGFPSRAHHLVALLEALADGQAAHRWWLRDADGLCLLSRPVALRTAILADPVNGQRALTLLSRGRRQRLVQTLGAAETDRVLDGLAEAAAPGATASFDACAEAVATVAAQSEPPLDPLTLYLQAVIRRPSAAGPILLETIRAFLRIGQARADAPLLSEDRNATANSAAATPPRATAEDALPERALRAAAPRLPESARRILLRESVRGGTVAATRSRVDSVFTQFGGLLLLLPSLEFAALARAVAVWPNTEPDTARLIAHAALGVCAGRARFAAYLGDPLWRELFGLDARAAAGTLRARLSAIPPSDWASLAALGQPIDCQRDARFLLANAGDRAARHALAPLARAIVGRFARRLWGFRDASAPFLWSNVLGVNAVLERSAAGWSARLARPPLDILLSLSRIAEGTVIAPNLSRIELTRVTA